MIKVTSDIYCNTFFEMHCISANIQHAACIYAVSHVLLRERDRTTNISDVSSFRVFFPLRYPFDSIIAAGDATR